MHITKESLSTMSLEDIRAERARHETIWKNAAEMVAMCNQAIADRVAEFTVGDMVVDGDDIAWKITDIKLQRWTKKDDVEYCGRRIKKDGTPGTIESEIYCRPLRAADSGNDGGMD
ncbi:hypothetical protein [Acidithiobacillus ferrooxidans]|uniref:hypothetical protein n=1 Tax=Acidithiobacillus ferrooxidans TaxID=920 RepID=UPI000B21ADB6|nr:hypothetical protein [Acidithiobacillus ferrooxidans]